MSGGSETVLILNQLLELEQEILLYLVPLVLLPGVANIFIVNLSPVATVVRRQRCQVVH